jgi:hypothetical protein
MFVARHIVSRQNVVLTRNQRHLAAGELARANFRAFGVEHYRYRLLFLRANLAEAVKPLLVLRVRPVRKVHSRNVHSAVYELSKQFRVVTGGSQCAYEFSF